MLGYKLIKIYPSRINFDYEADALLLINLKQSYLTGKIFFDKNIKDCSLIPVRAEYKDPKSGVIKAVTL